MISSLRSVGTTRILFGCCILQIAGCIFYGTSFAENGYLPSPFVYDKADTFMDFFHPMYWADEPGRYTDWGSVYPPINFIFLKGVRWLLFGQAYLGPDAFTQRDSASSIIPLIVVAFVTASLFVFRYSLWQGFTRVQTALFFVIFVLSSPVLFTIERGNLIILAPMFLALALGESGWRRAFAIGMLINIKPYFVLYLVGLAISRRSRELVSSAMTAGVIFLISGMLLDENFLEFVQNLFQFSQDQNLFSPREVLALPSSISAFTHVLRMYLFSGGNTSIRGVDISLLMILIESVKWLAILAAFLSFGVGGRRIPVETILATTTIAITNFGVSVGGYSFILYFCLIPIFCRMTYSWVYVACVFLIFAPIDAITLFSEDLGNRYSYLIDATVPVAFEVTLGACLRPVINLCLLLLTAFEIFKDYSPSRRELLATVLRKPILPELVDQNVSFYREHNRTEPI